jgi:hypothetical protein
MGKIRAGVNSALQQQLIECRIQKNALVKSASKGKLRGKVRKKLAIHSESILNNYTTETPMYYWDI